MAQCRLFLQKYKKNVYCYKKYEHKDDYADKNAYLCVFM